MHNSKVERFYKPQWVNGMVATAQGPIKTFPMRGIKESPPYLHDGRLPTLEGSAPELIDELTELERLDDQALWRVMAETVPLQNKGKSKTCCDATAPARSWNPSGSNCPCCNDRPI